jgi:lysophospholipase L1-like esterase
MMSQFGWVPVFFLCGIMLCQTGSAEALPAVGCGREWIRMRDGLARSARVFTATGKGRVAFIGGSITEMEGYRPLTYDVLSRQFPQTTFEFINAGISSTSSTTGAFRLPTDVLGQGLVDLLFIEFAVNDDQDAHHTEVEMIRAMEGMVRQARQHNPLIDIVFLYTANENHIRDFQSGKIPLTLATHERVAEYYGLPSICFAGDVAQRMARNEFDWKTFGGTHPAPYGAAIYAGDIAALLKAACTDQGEAVAHKMPAAAMDPLNYEQGHFVDIQSAKIENGWTISEPDWDTIPGKVRDRFVGIPMLWSDQPGATLRLPFSGSAIGIFLVSGPDAGILEYTIDDGEPQRVDLFTDFSMGLHYPWTCMFASDLPDGAHTLTLRIHDQKNIKSHGTAVRIKTFVENGRHL